MMKCRLYMESTRAVQAGYWHLLRGPSLRSNRAKKPVSLTLQAACRPVDTLRGGQDGQSWPRAQWHGNLQAKPVQS